MKKVFNVSNEETGENSATTFPIKEGMYGSEMTHEFLLSKCSLFVSNKWDGVPEKEVQRVKDKCIAKLEEIWPGFDSKSQLICMPVRYAKIAQQYQVVTKEFESLMNGLEGLVTKCINARLELHWR